MRTPFGTYVKLRRKQIKMTQSDLAKSMGISQQYLSDIEIGRAEPRSDQVIFRISKALGVSSDWLFFLSGMLPPDLLRIDISEKQVKESMRLLRYGRLRC